MKLTKKQIKTILYLAEANPSKKQYASVIAKKCDINYSYTNKIICGLEVIGLIETKKDEGKRLIELTSRGKRVSEGLKIIKEVI